MGCEIFFWIAVLYCLIGSSFGCQYMPCQNGTVERCEKYKMIYSRVSLKTMYVEEYKDEEGCRRSMCCEQGSPQIETFKRGPGCIATKCVDPKVGNPCDVIDLKKAGRRMNIKLEDTYNETCTLPGPGGRKGLMSICCQPGHPERFLTVGYAAEANEFPHQVRLSIGCAGTIYNKRWILTAAHCVTGDGKPIKASEILAKIGSNIESNTNQIFNVVEVKVHEGYSELLDNVDLIDNRQRVKCDIALLKLDKDIKFGKNAMALPLPPLNFNPLDYAKQGIIIGWGTADNYKTPQLLRKASVPLRDLELCGVIWRNPPYRFYSEQAICIGGIIKNVDGTLNHATVAGQGDSGGPAICKDKDGFAVLCGITSYGSSDAACLLKRVEGACLPNIYSSVSYFRPWIEENAGTQENAKVYKVKFLGQKTSPSKYSHQVKIRSTDVNVKACGGTIIARDKVLTAAHCVYKLEYGKVTKREGLRVEIQNKERKTYSVKEIFTKKWKNNFKVSNKLAFFNSPYRTTNFKVLDDFYYDYDIALLQLDEQIENVKPLQLPPSNFNPFEKGVKMTETAFDDNTEIFETRDIKLLTPSDCQHRFDALNLRVMDSSTPNFLAPEWNPVEAKTNQTQSKNSTGKVSSLSDFDEDVEESVENSQEKLPPTFTINDWNSMLQQLKFEKEGNSDSKAGSPEMKSKQPEEQLKFGHSPREILKWLKINMKDFQLSQRDFCYVEKYSGGTNCDRELGGGIICKNSKGQSYLCGVQTFRLCFGSFPNIAVDVRSIQKEISSLIN